MRKAATQTHSFAGFAWRLAAAASLAATLTAVACTTDRTPGAGQPERFMPAVAPGSPSATPGSEMNNPVNPPMISSYSGAPGAAVARGRDVDALATLAADQAFRGRVLGPADPGGVPGSSDAAGPTGQFINPSLETNPQVTVNSSISSAPTPVVSSGAGEGAGSALFGTQVISSGATTSAVTAANTSLLTPTISSASTISPTLAANTGATTATGVSTTLTTPVTTGAALIDNRGGLLTPTMSSAATIGPTLAANTGIAAATGRTTIVGTTARTAAVTTTRVIGSTSAPLLITRSTNGSVTITNIRDGATTNK